jgi:glycosyltransferase involved in cell wall biosynthesis
VPSGGAERAGQPTRVLQVSAFFAAHGGGIEAVAERLAHELVAAGLSVHWMAGGPAGEAPQGALPAGLSIDRAASWDPIEPRLGLPMPLWSWPALRRLWRAVGAADVLHLHDYLYLPTLLALLFARLRGKPVVLTQHIGEIGLASAAARALLRALNTSIGAWALARADRVAFVGRPVLSYFQPRVGWRHAPRLIANGVDHERFAPRLEPAASAAGRMPILFAGRFVEKKGLALLQHAARIDGVRWRFIGWGPLGPETWPAEDRAAVELIGRVSAAGMAAHYRAAALLVLPSTGEGFPLVLQEALACGTPVLVSTEVFEAFPQIDERCVFHVELRGSDRTAAAAALRARIEALVAEPARLAAAREPAAALARRWSWAACAGEYRALYGELLGPPAKTGAVRA